MNNKRPVRATYDVEEAPMKIGDKVRCLHTGDTGIITHIGPNGLVLRIKIPKLQWAVSVLSRYVEVIN